MVVVSSANFNTPVLLEGISWRTYESLLEDYESKPGMRLTYDRGLLEIMPPLPEHEFYSKTLSDLVDATTRALGIETHSLGRQLGSGRICSMEQKLMSLSTFKMKPAFAAKLRYGSQTTHRQIWSLKQTLPIALLRNLISMQL